MANQIPLIVNAGAAQIQELATADNLEISANIVAGGILTDGYYYANGTPVTFGGGSASLPLANGTSNFNIATANGNATVTADGKTWTFGTNGKLTTPGNVVIQNSGGIEYPASGAYEWDLHSSDGNVYIGSVTDMAYIDTYSPNISVRLRTNETNDWIFDPSGNLTLPDIASPSINYANGQPYGGSGSTSAAGNAGDIQINVAGNIGADSTLRYVDTGGEMTLYADYMNTSTVFTNDILGSGNAINISAQFGNSVLFDTTGGISATGNVTAADFTTTGSNGDITMTGGNITGANVVGANTVVGNGNLHLQPDPANTGSYLDIFLSSGPDTHIVASAGANLILGKDAGANVMTSWNGNVYIQSWTADFPTHAGGVWTFGGDGNLTLPSNSTIKNNAEISINIQVSDLVNATVQSPGSIVSDTYNNTGYEYIYFTDSVLYNEIIAAGITNNAIVPVAWNSGSTSTTGYVLVKLPGTPNVFGFQPCDLTDHLIIGDWVFPAVLDFTPANIAITAVGTGNSTWTFDATGNLTVPGAIRTASNSQLQMTESANTAYLGTTADDSTALYLTATTAQLYANVEVSISSNVGGGNAHGWAFDVDGNTNIPGNIISFGNIGITTNVGNTTSSWTFDDTGNLTLPRGGKLLVSGGIVGGGASPAPSLSGFSSLNAYGNITGGSILTGGYVSASGNVTANIFNLGNPGNLTYSSIQQNQNAPYGSENLGIELLTTTDDPGVFSSVSAGPDYVALKSTNAGNANVVLQGGYGITLSTSNATGGAIKNWTFTSAGSALFPGNISTTGNVTGNFFIGDGSQMTNLPAGNYSNSNVATFLGDFGSNAISTSGNITGGNVYATNIVAEASFSIQSSNFNAVVGNRYGVDTTSNPVTATLTAFPITGTAVFFADAGGAFATNNLIINPVGQTIMGSSGNMTVTTNNQSFGLFWNGSTWRTYNAG
jgi:hypothetical protein